MKDGELVKISDITTTEERAYSAYRLRLGGTSFTEISQTLGYASPDSASKAVKALIAKALGVASEDRKQEIIDLELDRLDALQHSVWGLAMTGDTRAVDSVLKIMSHRAKLLSLGDEQIKTTSSVIVSSDNYAQALKEIADDQ